MSNNNGHFENGQTMPLRKFHPLSEGHPGVGRPCGICGRQIVAGDETTLLPRGGAPADDQTGETVLCHWTCGSNAVDRVVGCLPDLLASFAHVAWLPPAAAKQPPVNQFHTLYIRLAEINDGLLHEAGADPDLARNDAFAELLGACADLSNTTARMTRMIEGIRRDFPKLWNAWQAAVEFRPEVEESNV